MMDPGIGPDTSIPNDQRGRPDKKATGPQTATIKRLTDAGVDLRSAEHRVITLGLTDEDIAWNLRLGRPLQWKETLDVPAESKRRQDWHDTHPGEK